MLITVQPVDVSVRVFLMINHGQNLLSSKVEKRENILMALHSALPEERHVVLPNIVCYCHQCIHRR